MLSDNSIELTIRSNFERAKEAQEEICREAQSLGYGEEVLFALRLSLEEALTNAISHGNGSDADKKVRIRRHITGERIEVEIGDEGEGFDPSSVADPTSEDNLGLPSGRGIHLMRAYMDEVAYSGTGSTVRLVKFNPHPASGALRALCTTGKLEISTAEHEEATVIALSGSADMAEAGELNRFLSEAASEKARLVIDLSGLSFIGSMGLGSLIKAQSVCRRHGGKVVLWNPQPEVHRVLKTTQLDQLFEICSSIEEAIRTNEGE